MGCSDTRLRQRAMTSTTAFPGQTSVASIQDEIDRARAGGPLRQVVIPPCPDLLVQLRKALAAAEPELAEVARIATSDVAMAASLLAKANAPAYAVGQPARTVGQAMNRLGLDETAATMAAFQMRRAVRVNSPHLQRFWERSTRRAAAMAFIARQLPGMHADLAQTLGLFLHVGLPVLMQSVRGYSGTLVEAAARTDRSFIATENANHRTDHAVVGALVARVWRLAPEVMAAIRLHHELADLGQGGAEPEVCSLVAASLVAEQLVRAHEGLDPDADWQQHAGAALGWLQIGEVELSEWREELGPLLDAAST